MTTPEQLCEFIMAKARGEKVEIETKSGGWLEMHGDLWNPALNYRIAPKPKKKILRQAVLISRGKYFIPDTLYENTAQIADAWLSASFVQWYGEPIEVEEE